LWGCELRFTYPIVKLRDYRTRRAELEASDNPFATVVLAHLAVQDTRRSAIRRREVKLALTRRLYERGYSRERVLSLFRFIDWLLALPAKQETLFWREIQEYEEERKMPYVTSVERMGLARGRDEGRAEGRDEGRAEGRDEGRAEGRDEGTRETLRRFIQARFGVVPPAVEQRIAAAERATLDQLIERAAVVQTIDDL